MPPSVVDAVNVMLVPAQVLLVLADMEMVGTKLAFTTMEMPLDIAVTVDKQFALLVNTQVTISPLLNAVVVNVGLLLPALMPFTCH